MRINIIGNIRKHIECTVDLKNYASLDKPYYINFEKRDTGCEMFFNYLYDEELREKRNTQDGDFEFGVVSGKIYNLKCKEDSENELLMFIDCLCQKLEKNNVDRFKLNISMAKDILEASIPAIFNVFQKINKKNKLRDTKNSKF